MWAQLKILANDPLQRCVRHCTTAIHAVDGAGLQLAEKTVAAEADRQSGRPAVPESGGSLR